MINGRYRDHGDGTVTDVQTGLQWMRCALGQNWHDGKCLGNATGYSWSGALGAAKTLNQQGGYATHRDWRVPTLDELKTLIRCSSGRRKDWNGIGELCVEGSTLQRIDRLAFPDNPIGVLSVFWSSSPYAYSWGDAWSVDFDYGDVGYGNRNYQQYVRLVRGGQ